MAGENHDKNPKDGPWGAAIQSQNTSQSSNINEHNIDLKLTLGGVYAENDQVEKTPLVHSTPTSSSINGFNYQPLMAPQEIPPSRLAALAAEQVANNEAFRRAIGVIKENNSSETLSACTDQAFIASARYKQAMPTNIAENERVVISSYFSPPSSMVFPHRNIKGKPVLPFNFQYLAAPIELCNTSLENGKQLVTTINPISRPVMITDCGLETRSVKPFEDENGSTSSKKAKTYKHFMRQDSQVALMQKMPSVTSTGGIPNGQKIEGFLYKYGPDRVVIVCLCHGRFLCPAEFVKHAGGGDIENPMKHIKILVQW